MRKKEAPLLKNLDEEVKKAWVRCAKIAAVIIIVPAIFLISGIMFSINAIETTAFVTDYKITTDSEGDKSYKVYYEYTDEVDWYTGDYKSSFKPRKTMPVYYNPNRPQVVATSRNSKTFWRFIITAVAITIAASITYSEINIAKRSVLRKELLANGRRVLATLTDVVDGRQTRGEQKSRNMVCEFRDEATGDTHVFKSDDLWDDIPQLGAGQQMPPVPVYVDNSSYKKFYIAVDEFLEEFL